MELRHIAVGGIAQGSSRSFHECLETPGFMAHSISGALDIGGTGPD
jgi:hypothetical protein